MLAGINLEVLIRAYRNLEVFGRLQQYVIGYCTPPVTVAIPHIVRSLGSKESHIQSHNLNAGLPTCASGLGAAAPVPSALPQAAPHRPLGI